MRIDDATLRRPAMLLRAKNIKDCLERINQLLSETLARVVPDETWSDQCNRGLLTLANDIAFRISQDAVEHRWFFVGNPN